MKTFDDIELLESNIGENSEEYVIVQLVKPSSDEKKCEKAKSGLVRIPNIKQLRHKDQRLRRDFKSWRSPYYQLNEVGNEESQSIRTESREFHDVASCIEYIKSCNNKSIVLILSSYYIRDKRLVSKLEQFPQIAFIYRRTSEKRFNKWLERWSLETQFFIPKILPRSVVQIRVQDIDEASQLLLMQLFFAEIILKLPRTDEAKEEFLAFCRAMYHNEPTNLAKIEDFETTYNENDAVNWYTRPNSFIFRIVCRTCASFDLNTFFKIRFFLRDLYMQLQQLHQQQLTTLLQTDLLVHRGVMMSQDELRCMRTIGDLFVTRNFLSTTTDEDVARLFSGDGIVRERQASALVSMHIDREELSEKPVAFINEVSQISPEDEVMLSMGTVFRIVSYEEVNGDSTYVVKIKMIRSKEEQEIEKELTRFHLLAATAASSPLLGMAIFLGCTQNSQCHGQYCTLMSHALKPSDPQIADELCNMSKLVS
jgi:hypothetical protein